MRSLPLTAPAYLAYSCFHNIMDQRRYQTLISLFLFLKYIMRVNIIILVRGVLNNSFGVPL